jgi:hypothetical protein
MPAEPDLLADELMRAVCGGEQPKLAGPVLVNRGEVGQRSFEAARIESDWTQRRKKGGR